MDSVLRRFGLKKSDQRDGRQGAPKDVFGFSQCVEYGFPHKASAIAFHPQLSLLALGTETGSLRIYGAPGVQISSTHKDEVAVVKIFFFGQMNIVTLCVDNSVHLWEIGTRERRSYLHEIRSLSLEHVFNAVSSTSLLLSRCHLLLGTDNGHIYTLDLRSFKLLDQVIFQENIMQNAPEEFRRNPGAVESIAVHPHKPEKLLIGYNRGLIVLWDTKQKKTEQMYNSGQELECVVFHQNGKEFMSTHVNGSHIVWKVSETNRPKEQTTTPYGPFPCKTINKMEWKMTESVESMMIFSGGMPRASYGDNHTVTVMQGDRHVVFDFTSKVIDFFVVCASDEVQHGNAVAEHNDPSCLFVLLEEELVVIDLETEGWPMFHPPYLATVHSTAITCTAHVADATGNFFQKVREAGRKQFRGFSSRDWPVHGGLNMQREITVRDILITGHEDGSVRFWDVSSVDIVLLYKLSTSGLFSIPSSMEEEKDLDMDEEWPPFRKVGTYDPFSDDPRLGIQKIAVSIHSETLILGGTAGQVVILRLDLEDRQVNARRVDVNIVGDRDNFIWKGHEALPMKKDWKFPSGFQPLGLVQIHPPAACTALSLNPDWQVLAVGTSHGFGVIDYSQMAAITFKCTLNLSDTSGVGESTMSRRKSFKKSLRESFRRLRSRRSERRRKTEIKEDDTKMRPITSPGGRNLNGASGSASRQRQTHVGAIDIDLAKPVERQVEARSKEDVSGSIVRTLYFVETYLTSGQSHTPTFWAGTNAGYIYMYQLTVPSGDRRSNQAVQSLLVKEIHLKHRAPVVSICVVDHGAIPFLVPSEVQPKTQPTPEPDLSSGSHSVIICSEEQLKVFSLPSLNARDKFKLTANEGSKLRKVSYVNFRSPSVANHVECDLVCLTNLGETQVFSLPHLKRIFTADCIRRENIIGIVSCIFTRNGDAFYLSSPSEFMRFSISGHQSMLRPVCTITAATSTTAPEGAGDHSDAGAHERSPRNKSHLESVTQSRVPAPHIVGDRLDDDVGYHVPSPNDDSVTSGDTTEDSVRVHVSEDPASPLSSDLANNVVITRHIVTTTSTTVETSANSETHSGSTSHGNSA